MHSPIDANRSYCDCTTAPRVSSGTIRALSNRFSLEPRRACVAQSDEYGHQVQRDGQRFWVKFRNVPQQFRLFAFRNVLAAAAAAAAVTLIV
jgi:hypothetical protein